MSVQGKTVVLTGATSGIGRAAAFALADRGAHLALLCRDRQRAEVLQQQLRAEVPGAHTKLYIGDLSSQADVRHLASELLAGHPRIDVLLHNAGAMFAERQESVDGIELTWATNHLAPFLLTHLLLPALLTSAPARIVTVSSGLQARAKLDFDDLERRRHYRRFDAYSQSKLANVMFTYELARRLSSTAITANCLHPGVVRTALVRSKSKATSALLEFAKHFLISPERGARTLVYLAADPAIESNSGGYYIRCKLARTQRITYDARACARLWRISAEQTGLPANLEVR